MLSRGQIPPLLPPGDTAEARVNVSDKGARSLIMFPQKRRRFFIREAAIRFA
jgi:hypothetical protein